jgi:hypothetical protein
VRLGKVVPGKSITNLVGENSNKAFGCTLPSVLNDKRLPSLDSTQVFSCPADAGNGNIISMPTKAASKGNFTIKKTRKRWSIT